MKKSFLCFLFLLTSFLIYGQQLTDFKKVEGIISHEYQSNISPIQIEYKVFPYKGSGSYSYRWRLQGQEFSNTSSNDTFSTSFNCENGKRPECTIFCEVTDQNTQKTFILKHIHAVEYCN